MPEEVGWEEVALILKHTASKLTYRLSFCSLIVLIKLYSFPICLSTMNCPFPLLSLMKDSESCKGAK